MDRWVPTREEGLRRLRAFLPRAGRAYAKLRNYDLGEGAHEHVSTLSPWIRHRLILEEEVVSAVLDRHSFSAAEKFIQEVFWRTYWKGWLELRPSVWRDYCHRLQNLVDILDRDADLRDRWGRVTAGETGIDCFDAWSRELVETGYLHNHARMWFASIWIFTLELPWELGADFFLRHLLDGDPASNTLSWRWVAGLQTRGKTYLARADNIARFTEGRFDPAGRLSPVAKPREGPPPPTPLPPPRPIAWNRHLPTGLLLTEEDLHPEFLLATDPPVHEIAVMTATERRSPLGVSLPVQDFVDGAVEDALHRLSSRLGVGAVRPAQADHSAAILDWARANDLRQIVTPYAPVGPTATALAALANDLAALDIALVPALRRWDRLSWPHASRGFFQFRDKIPTILSAVRNGMTSAA